jgi:hypothetical protein
MGSGLMVGWAGLGLGWVGLGWGGLVGLVWAGLGAGGVLAGGLGTARVLGRCRLLFGFDLSWPFVA